MDFKSGDEGEERFCDPTYDGMLTSSNLLESLVYLRVEVDDIVEPVEKARDGNGNPFDPRAVPSSKRQGENLYDSS
jgi:hypothetical protein